VSTRLPIRATLGVKLAVVLFAVVAGALGIVYAMVVPRLEDRLVDAKVRDLERTAPPFVTPLGREDAVRARERVTFAAARLNARVVLYSQIGRADILPILDSAEADAAAVSRDPVALGAASTRTLSSGRVERGNASFAEVGIPVTGGVVLVSAPLDDALANVRLVRRSLIVAGLVALAAAAAAAYVAALGLTRRLRRLESATDRIAAGDFAAPVPETSGEDEIAQLARGFDAMRVRLADLDRVRREFIANASHELRTPLFSLGGFLELLADEELDAETRREFLAETRTQVERLTRLATDLLDLSRLDAGQLAVERGEVDVGAAARAVCEEFRAVAEAEEHALSVTARDEAIAVGDHERVVQIGRILVENALRHTPRGTPVELLVSRENGRAVLAVRDEGPGIPPGEQEHVFERFYRAGGGKASGSGLGLAIASELAVRMDGTLTVRSRAGETVFTLALPAAEAVSREITPRPEPARA
jgi:signal transduction histidine kinase